MIDPNIAYEDLFYSDYFGVRLTPGGQHRVVTWSSTNDILDVPFGSPVAAAGDITPYLGEIERAFQLWDDALDTISFQRTDAGNDADITVALTDLGGRGGTWGFWNSTWDFNRIVTKSSIQFDIADAPVISMVTIALHEIGNVLGLGDINPTTAFRSIMEDPIPETFLSDTLWEEDVALIRRYYEEGPLLAPIQGTGGNDRLVGSSADDTVDGAGGRDTYVLSDDIDGYSLSVSPDGTLILSDNGRGVSGTDALTSIEGLEFGEGNVWFPDGAVDLTQFTGIAQLTPAEIGTFVEMYIAYFDRAPDALGLNYWGTRLSQGMTLDEIATSFFVQPETTALYPDTLDNGALVRAAYDNFLERAPDQAGLDYWTSELDAGFSRGKFMLALINGARANDAPEAQLDVQTIEAKADIGVHFAVIHGLTDVEQATDVMRLYERGEAAGYGEAMRLTDQYAAAATAPGSEQSFSMPLAGVVDDPSLGVV